MEEQKGWTFWDTVKVETGYNDIVGGLKIIWEIITKKSDNGINPNGTTGIGPD